MRQWSLPLTKQTLCIKNSNLESWKRKQCILLMLCWRRHEMLLIKDSPLFLLDLGNTAFWCWLLRKKRLVVLQTDAQWRTGPELCLNRYGWLNLMKLHSGFQQSRLATLAEGKCEDPQRKVAGTSTSPGQRAAWSQLAISAQALWSRSMRLLPPWRRSERISNNLVNCLNASHFFHIPFLKRIFVCT